MITVDPNTYFDCVLPRLEDDEEEVWFSHPTEAIKCNQLGALDFNEEDYSIIDLPHKSCYLRRRDSRGKFLISIGTKANLVWECYHQRSAPGRILHLNHNELDYTFENLFSTEGESPYNKLLRNKEKQEWVKDSARVLVRKEAAAAAKGLDKDTYRAFMRFPAWLIKAADSL